MYGCFLLLSLKQDILSVFTIPQKQWNLWQFITGCWFFQKCLFFAKSLVSAKKAWFLPKRLGFFQSWCKTSFLCEKFSWGIIGNLLLEHGKRGEDSCFWKWKNAAELLMITFVYCFSYYLFYYYETKHCFCIFDIDIWSYRGQLVLSICEWYIFRHFTFSLYDCWIIWNRVNFVCFLHSYLLSCSIKYKVHHILFQILSQGREWAWSSVCHSQERNLPKWKQQREAPLAETSGGKLFREGNCDLGTIQNKPW